MGRGGCIYNRQNLLLTLDWRQLQQSLLSSIPESLDLGKGWRGTEQERHFGVNGTMFISEAQ